MTSQLTTEMTAVIIACVALSGIAAILFAMAQIRYEKSKKLRREAEKVEGNCIEVSNIPVRYGMDKSRSFYEIYGVYLSVDRSRNSQMLIKRFPFGDDPEFARLEAQELLDHLKEK